MSMNLVECGFCRTNAKGEPCPRPESVHRAGIEIHAGPNREGQYQFTRWWWRSDIRRQKAQVFLSEPPKRSALDIEEWAAAWKVWRAGRPSWHI